MTRAREWNVAFRLSWSCFLLLMSAAYLKRRDEFKARTDFRHFSSCSSVARFPGRGSIPGTSYKKLLLSSSIEKYHTVSPYLNRIPQPVQHLFTIGVKHMQLVIQLLKRTMPSSILPLPKAKPRRTELSVRGDSAACRVTLD